MSMTDSIFALATPIGGALALIRASGPLCARAALELTGKPLMDKPRLISRVRLTHANSTLDEAMAVCYHGPNSYTGEDMLELYLHGSPAVVRAVGGALMALGLRGAQPGEFTRRAFLNAKMDLIEAEAVMDLINAEADESARAALEQLDGKLSGDVCHVEALLYESLSSLNAAIDYPEELEDDVYAELPAQLLEAGAILEGLLNDGMRARVLREGFRLALIGAPNAGKSSLLNALLGYDRAIVTQQAGTTRDLLEEKVLLDGLPLRLYDTAGLREAEDEAERQGVERARAAIANADGVLLLLDGAAGAPDITPLKYVKDKPVILVGTKADLERRWRFSDIKAGHAQIDVSVLSAKGLDELRAAIKAMIGPVQSAYVTNQRHIDAMQKALISIEQAKSAPDADSTATDIREALIALGEITGRAVDAEVIDRIFERFCVGK